MVIKVTQITHINTFILPYQYHTNQI